MMFFNSGTGANALPSAFPHPGSFPTPMVAAGHVYRNKGISDDLRTPLTRKIAILVPVPAALRA
jgi:hypothetical protein